MPDQMGIPHRGPNKAARAKLLGTVVCAWETKPSGATHTEDNVQECVCLIQILGHSQ